MSDEITNRVANSPIITLDLASFYPDCPIKEIDIKPWLFQGLMLKEQSFRESLNNLDPVQYEGQIVCFYCSADAIIPNWAWMLLTVHFGQNAKMVCYGRAEDAVNQHYVQELSKLDLTSYTDKSLIIKGCGDRELSPFVYAHITGILLPYAKSIMFGEPCSTVPVYKKLKK